MSRAAAVVLAATLAGVGCNPPHAYVNVAAFGAPKGSGAYAFRHVEWRPIPGRVGNDGSVEMLLEISEVDVDCVRAQCLRHRNGTEVLPDGTGALPREVEVRISKPGFKTLATTIPINGQVIVLLEPEATP